MRLLLLILILLWQSSAVYDRSVTVLVLDARRTCQWVRAKLFDSLNCSVGVTVPNVSETDRRALQGTRISLLEYSGSGRLDTPDFVARFVAANGRTPRILCTEQQACRPIRRAPLFAQIATEVERRVAQDPLCGARRTRDLQ